MLADDVEAAGRGWFRTSRRTLRRLRDGDWDGRGDVAVTDAHLVFEGTARRRTSLRTVEGVARWGALVWVRRRRAHDWLVWCETEAEARDLEAQLRDAVRRGDGPS